MINQIKKFKLYCFTLCIAMSVLFTSCNTNEIVDVSAFTEDSIESLQCKAIGKTFCLELIFPVSISFFDGTVDEVESYEALYESISSFYTSNEIDLTEENRPQFVYPIDVVNDDGELINVSSEEELLALADECPRKKSRKKRKRGYKCFSLVFPATVTIDGQDITFQSKEELKLAIKAYKEVAGDDAVKPALVFPVSVEMEDGTIIEVTSSEMLQELKDSCSEE